MMIPQNKKILSSCAMGNMRTAPGDLIFKLFICGMKSRIDAYQELEDRTLNALKMEGLSGSFCHIRNRMVIETKYGRSIAMSCKSSNN